MTNPNSTHIKQRHTQLEQLLDRADLTDLLARLGAALDEHRFDALDAILTEDATISTPGGTAQGREHVVAQAVRNHEEFGRLQHNFNNILIDLDGDRADMRANLIGVFGHEAEPHPVRVSGAVNRYQAVRTDDGWRIATMEIKQVWRAEAPDHADFHAAHAAS